MNPPALQAQADNDARLARPVVFQTKAGAVDHAERCARNQSPTQAFRRIDHTDGLLQAVEGGKGFLVTVDVGDDWRVLTLSAAEVELAVQRGIRSEVAAAYEKARKYDADGAPVTAKRIRLFARELEMKLTASIVRASEWLTGKSIARELEKERG